MGVGGEIGGVVHQLKQFTVTATQTRTTTMTSATVKFVRGVGGEMTGHFLEHLDPFQYFSSAVSRTTTLRTTDQRTTTP